MNLRIAITVFLSVLFISSAAIGQQPTASPTPPPPITESAKPNERPAPTPVIAAEPFDKAVLSTMAAKCVKLESEAGVIEIELFPESAPETVRNFLNLVATGLLDTTTFRRVVPGFVVQGGNIWSRAEPVTREIGTRARRTIPDEPNKILHERGILSMARGDEENSATTNFFILLTSASYLDGKFTAFGRVTKGMDVVEAINKAPVNGEKPDKPVKISKAVVISCP